jgi:hypothetical protein
MSTIKFNPRAITVLAFILVIGLFRALIPIFGNANVLANYSAVGAIAMFGAAYFNNNAKAFGFPLLTLLISDLILSATFYSNYSTGFLYEGWYLVYGAFALMVLASKFIIKNVSVASVVMAAVATVLIHWIVTDLGVWYGSTMYPQTLSGYLMVLNAAIPFELRFFNGTLGYSAVMFGLFEYLKSKFPALQSTRNGILVG